MTRTAQLTGLPPPLNAPSSIVVGPRDSMSVADARFTERLVLALDQTDPYFVGFHCVNETSMVRQVQQALIALGLPIIANGEIVDETDDNAALDPTLLAIGAFQRAVGLSPTGVITSATRAHLVRALVNAAEFRRAHPELSQPLSASGPNAWAEPVSLMTVVERLSYDAAPPNVQDEARALAARNPVLAARVGAQLARLPSLLVAKFESLASILSAVQEAEVYGVQEAPLSDPATMLNHAAHRSLAQLIFTRYALPPNYCPILDELAALRATDPAGFASLSSALERHHIRCVNRFYSLEQLRGLLANLEPQPNDRRPVALVLTARDDWNGAFTAVSHECLALSQHYRVVYQEASTDEELVATAISVTEHQRASFVQIGGHGEPTRLELESGGLPQHTLAVDDAALLRRLRHCMTENATVVLGSCSTGAARDGLGQVVATSTRRRTLAPRLVASAPVYTGEEGVDSRAIGAGRHRLFVNMGVPIGSFSPRPEAPRNRTRAVGRLAR